MLRLASSFYSWQTACRDGDREVSSRRADEERDRHLLLPTADVLAQRARDGRALRGRRRQRGTGSGGEAAVRRLQGRRLQQAGPVLVRAAHSYEDAARTKTDVRPVEGRSGEGMQADCLIGRRGSARLGSTVSTRFDDRTGTDDERAKPRPR